MANWSELPEEIIDLIVKRLTCVENFVKFGAVCKPWRSVAIWKNRQPFAPWLMLTTDDNDNDNEGIRSFYSLSLAEEEKKEKLFRLQLPQAHGRRCWGSPCGWLITLGLDLNIQLLNPLTRIQISLPSQPTLRELVITRCDPSTPPDSPERIRWAFLAKFAFSSNPTSLLTTTVPPSLVIMAIFGSHRELAFTTLGDEAWTTIPSGSGGEYANNEDVLFFNGQFYAVHFNGILRVCDINITPPKATDIACPPERVDPTDRFYLVEMSRDLHLVARIFYDDDDAPDDEFYYKTHHFEVFKFDFDTNNWSLVDHLGDHALFVGNNYSFAISTTIYSGFRGNCIYFTDDHCASYGRQFSDMGVFDYETEDVEPFGFDYDVNSSFSRPLFFMPCL